MSTLKADTIVASDGSSPVTLTKQEAVKHNMSYDAVSTTTRSSLNQSSLTDSSTGKFKSNLTNNFASATDKVSIHTCYDRFASDGATDDNRGSSGSTEDGAQVLSTSIISTRTGYGANTSSNGAVVDFDAHYIATFGDLA